jgi:hypothetical protein
MTAEVENLLAALDGMNWPECINAAELIRSQAEEISRLQTDYAALMNKYIQPCCQQWDTCERQCIPLVKHLREQLAAAARQEPFAYYDRFNHFVYVGPHAAEQARDALAGGNGVTPLYAAPIPAGDAVSVSARCCGHEWYQGACVHCNLPVHEYKRPK